MQCLINSCYQYAAPFKKEGIGVALSGGGDSLALCMALKKSHIPFKALHFNHNLRPEALVEEKWLRDLCQSWQIPFYSQSWQSPPKEGSLQANARFARYDFFEESAQQFNLKHIFIAHTLDDVLETILMRLFYGSNTRGLAAMPQISTKAHYTLHRPLLAVSSSDLRAFLKEMNLAWLEDPSNYKTNYVRVRARYWLKMMPDDVKSELLRFSQGCAQLEQALEIKLQSYKNNCIEHGNKSTVVDSTVLNLPNYARMRLFKDVFQTLQPDRHLPRSKKQQLLFAALENPRSDYFVGHVHFHRKGEKIFAWPDNLNP